MAENEKFSKKLDDEQLDQVAGGKTSETNDILAALKTTQPAIVNELEQVYKDAIASGETEHHARGIANRHLKGVLCGLLDLDPEKTFLHRDNVANVYVTNSGKTLSTKQVVGLIVDDF